MASSFLLYSLLFFSLYISLLPESLLSQNPPCNDLLLTYTSDSVTKIPPNLTDSAKQPYKFKSTLTLTNNGLKSLKSWRVFVGFQNDEYLYSASNAVLADGSEIPGRVGNGTVFAGYPASDLKTAWETAGDENLYSTRVELSGSEFGSKDVSMPRNFSLANDGFICNKMVKQGNNSIQTCCKEDPTFKANTTADDDKFLPRQKGDLTIMYDVVAMYASSYLALVEIENHNYIGRLDYWKLSWDWMREEFINSMQGAYTDKVDASACVDGPQGQYYQDTDFSKVLNCQRRPTIIDLPLEKTNDTALGMIPNCCRNGTILPKSMDATKSKSAFQINVQKMPPDFNRTELYPPQNWKIKGTLNPDYVCGPPIRVSSSEYPDSSGLPVNKTAFASWQVVCNITKPKGSSPKCCVSFSAYYNESIVPCNTCACGCSSASSQSCSTTSPALLLPSQALLVPFENRTTLVSAWSQMNHRTIPNPMPCGDNCGVSINWHLYTDYKKGWTARMTIFNWDETPFADWFAAVQLDNAGPGFEKAYSFNGTAFNNGIGDKNNSIFMQGLPGLNYIVAESDGKDPIKDPRVPGKQQSVLSFTKKMTPGINVVAGDGFPTKVYFNGEECALPSVLPTSGASVKGVSVLLSIVFLFLLQLW